MNAQKIPAKMSSKPPELRIERVKVPAKLPHAFQTLFNRNRLPRHWKKYSPDGSAKKICSKMRSSKAYFIVFLFSV
jgi:hypothetical protein